MTEEYTKGYQHAKNDAIAVAIELVNDLQKMELDPGLRHNAVSTLSLVATRLRRLAVNQLLLLGILVRSGWSWDQTITFATEPVRVVRCVELDPSTGEPKGVAKVEITADGRKITVKHKGYYRLEVERVGKI